MIDSRCCYYLINCFYNKALTFKNSKEPSKQSGLLSDVSEDSQQEVWMLKKTHFENVYYLTHCLTGLVLEKNKNKLELRHRHEKPAQYFIIKESHGENGEVWIKEYAEPTNLLIFEKALECKNEINTKPEALWNLKKVTNNGPLGRSSIISCQFSGLVLQADIDSDKSGKAVQKSEWIGCFNQRWQIKKVNAFFIIRNMKNKQLISLHDKKIKDGNAVILASENSTYHYQLWSLQERGYKTYSIKTAYDQQLYIGSKDHNLKEGSTLILVKNQFKNLWKITGPIHL